jgi:hypothetical protein
VGNVVRMQEKKPRYGILVEKTRATLWNHLNVNAVLKWILRKIELETCVQWQDRVCIIMIFCVL